MIRGLTPTETTRQKPREQAEFIRGGLDTIFVTDLTRDPTEDKERNLKQVMRVDVGVWTTKKISAADPKAYKDLKLEDGLESHWLRFEKFMGDKQYLGTSQTDGRFILTDVDFLMAGNTFYKLENPDLFEFRSV